MEFRKKIMISATSILATLFVVFGATWWERIWFFASLNEDYIKKTITLDIHSAGG